MQQWNKDLTKANKYFVELIQPVMEKIFKAKFDIVETRADIVLCKKLDQNSGIDLFCDNANGMRGMGLRVQNGKSFGTFTIRKERDSGAKTEYEKRKFAIKNDYLYPHLTLQAYIDNNKIEDFAVAKTKDIIQMIDSGFCKSNRTTNASFYIVKWIDLEKNKCDIYIYSKHWRP
jgi:hypothetical protein